MNIGVMFRSDWDVGCNHLSLFEIGFHHHLTEEMSPCPFRGGVDIAIMGFHMAFGIFA